MTDESMNGEEDTREPWNPLDVDPLFDRFYSFVDSLDSGKQKAYLVGWLLLAAVLIVASSIPLPQEYRWVSATVGFPAGVILFFAGIAVIHSTSLSNLKLFQLKETVPPSRRVGGVIVGFIILAALLFTAREWMPFGLGGAIVIVATLSAFNIIRRSPEEIELARHGIPDPREINFEEFDDDEEEELDEEPAKRTRSRKRRLWR